MTLPRVLVAVAACLLLAVASLLTLAAYQHRRGEEAVPHVRQTGEPPAARRATDGAAHAQQQAETHRLPPQPPPLPHNELRQTPKPAPPRDRDDDVGDHAELAQPPPKLQEVKAIPTSPQQERPAAPDTPPPARFCQAGQPVKKIVYIKTHKTGSSTLTNIFHRFGEKHQLKFAVPRDNLFYGWPHLATNNIINSVETLGDIHPPYEMLCSAHVRYNRDALDSLVPGGAYVTILRDPLEHFSSSWYHWSVHEHIVQAGGPRFEPLEFLRDYQKNRHWLRNTDLMLTVNSFMFDLGVTNPTAEDVDKMIKELEEKFAIVLITEHMLPSLLMMKRMFCWDLEDVLHLSLKVATNKPRKTSAELAMDEEKKRYVSQINWADLRLYHHFNRTLWERIAREPDFDQELAKLEVEVAKWSTRCREYTRWEEDSHRINIEERPENSPEKIECHRMWLDSKGYAKHIKHDFNYPVEKLECWASFPAKRILHMVTDQPADDVYVSMLAQWMVLNPSETSLAVPGARNVHPGQLDPPSDEYYASTNTFMFAIPGFIYNRPQMEKLTTGLIYMAVFRHPVQEFLDAWKLMGLTERLRQKANDQTLTLEDFLAAPDKYLKLMSDDTFNARYHLVDRQAYRMGFPREKFTEGHVLYLMKHLWWFAYIAIAEHMEASMVMWRRTLCWPIEAVTYFESDRWALSTSHKLSDFFTGKMPVPQMEAAIVKLNRFDSLIFKRNNDTLWGKIDRQVSYSKEVKQFRDLRAKATDQCQRLREKYSESEMKKMAPRFEGLAADERKYATLCYLARLPREEIYDFVRATQPHLRKMAFPQPAPPGEEPY